MKIHQELLKLDIFQFSGPFFANLLFNFVYSKIDFLGAKIRLTSAVLDGFS